MNPQHGRSRSGNFRVLPPTSPGPVRNSTDISLAQLVPNDDEEGESSHEPQEEAQGSDRHETENPLHLHLEDATNPPPDYTSPTQSDSGHERRDSVDSENAPLIRVVNRSRGNSAAVPSNQAPGSNSNHMAPPETDRTSPVPSYRAAVRQGAGQARRDSTASEDSMDSRPSVASEQSATEASGASPERAEQPMRDEQTGSSEHSEQSDSEEQEGASGHSDGAPQTHIDDVD